ncbi:MAG: Swt1 family HEPN domain-containing protein [Candidatus Paceibacterota bacterium]
MAKSNREKIGEAITLFRNGISPFVERELKSHYGDDWKKQVAETLRFNPGEDWDTWAYLAAMWETWNLVFRKTLGHAERSIVSELRDVRNKWAHEKTFSSDDTYRAMDSMERLLEAVSAGDIALAINQQKMEIMRLKLAEQTRHDAKRRAAGATEGSPASGLPSWRDIIEPHDDVASGNYQQAEFAADLNQVYTNRAAAEYGDPVEFFRRTYLTQGLRDLLTNSLKRLVQGKGDPVVALQTNFGGGKTHSLLALFHLFSGTPVSQLPNVDDLISALGIEELPTVKRSVLVGQYMSPGEVHKMPDGTKVRTLWGEMAWQLAGKKGYELVRQADESGTNPGRSLIKLFDMAGPCLILIDEWIAYARQLYEKHDLPAGSFDTQFTFAQALTEAAADSKNTFVVVSIPSSDIELGGTAGKEALNRLENVVARKEATWQPASSEEGFEIVRRRLFKPIVSDDLFRQRDTVVRAFIETYRAGGKDFPADAGSADYEKRMKAAFPIHPDLFDRLYTEWSTLDRFQRTRGVLRLMAAVIHELWEQGDQNLMILPGMLPLHQPTVTKELIRYLEPSWPVIVEADVDGPDSTPLSIDRENSNLGRFSAARRVARTVFLGTAPMRGTANRGKDIRQINLGCVQPGESTATFGDALRRLQNKAKYLHTDGERTYYDPAQNISRDAESRKEDFSNDAVHERITKLIKTTEKDKADFERVHPCPSAPSEVVDESSARLVILQPADTHTSASTDSRAVKQAEAYLNSRGSGPRIYRNMLVFAAPDHTRLTELEDAVRWSMAWDAIYTKREELDLNQSQIRTADAKRKEWEGVIGQRLSETYCWLIVPTQLKSSEPVSYEAFRLRGSDSIAERAAKKLADQGALVTVYGSNLLRMVLDDIPLWRGNHVLVKQLCEDFAQYLYLPRLKNDRVVIASIEQGISMLTWADDGFAYAQDFDADRNRYIGLTAGRMTRVTADHSSLVVKPSIAAAQLAAAAAAATTTGTGTTPVAGPTPGGATVTGTTITGGTHPIEPPPAKPKRFYGQVTLDATRLGRDAGRIAEEVLSHLAGLQGAKAEVTLDIEVRIPEGVPDNVVRTVTENCRTLKFDNLGFEEE